MAFLPLPLANDFVSDGGGGVLDLVCPSASDGRLATMSANTKSRGVNFMGSNPLIVNEPGKMVKSATLSQYGPVKISLIIIHEQGLFKPWVGSTSFLSNAGAPFIQIRRPGRIAGDASYEA